jgi:hypothetical protein
VFPIDVQHALFWVAGMVVGCMIVGMTAKSYSDGHRRPMRPLVAILAAFLGLGLGWALNAWFDYVRFTQIGGGGSM